MVAERGELKGSLPVRGRPHAMFAIGGWEGAGHQFAFRVFHSRRVALAAMSVSGK